MIELKEHMFAIIGKHDVIEKRQYERDRREYKAKMGRERESLNIDHY